MTLYCRHSSAAQQQPAAELADSLSRLAVQAGDLHLNPDRLQEVRQAAGAGDSKEESSAMRRYMELKSQQELAGLDNKICSH